MSIFSHNLEAFLVCAEEKNFTKAAKRLFITQSALSQRIKNLEDELETTIFLRLKSGVKLTEKGEELLRFTILEKSIKAEFLRKLQGNKSIGPSGLLRIGGFSTAMRSVVLKSLSPFLEKNVNVEFKMMIREMDQLPGLLYSGEVDYLIYGDILQHQGIVSHVLGYEKNVLIEQTGFNGPDIYLDHDELDETTVKYLKLKKGTKIKRRYMDDVYGLIDGVKSGLGRAVVPLHLLYKVSGIKILNPKKSLDVPLVLHYYEASYYSQLHYEVVKILTDNVPDYLA